VFSGRSRFGSEENALSRALAEARAEGRAILDLTASNPTLVDLAPSAEAVLPHLARAEVARYRPTPLGLMEAREAVARATSSSAERTLLTASTSEAYALLLKLLTDPGDVILVPSPSYPLLEVLAQLVSLEVRTYPLRSDGEWHVDLAALGDAIDERVRAIVAVSPNNPTGSYLDRETHDRMLATGLPLIIDEVFQPYALEDEAPAIPSATRGLVFRLSGLSKLVALPQMKLGWASASGEDAMVSEAMRRLEHLNDAFLSASAVVQEGVMGLLELAPEVQERTRRRCRTNLGALDAALVGTSLGRMRVEGGWYAIVRLPRIRSEEAWVLGLLEEGVLVQPGWFYDFEEEAYVVLSLITPEGEFAEGLARLVAHVEAAI
jgi:aspartate/methionine/tyrosine aminotransferase